MTRKRFEVGSEYSLDAAYLFAQEDNLYSRLQNFQTVYYNSGRSAIRSVLRHLKGKKALLPAYICQSVIQAFEHEQYSVDFYKIKTDLSIDVEDIKEKCTSGTDILFVMHYFGSLQNQNDLTDIKNLCNTSSLTIIEDTTHCILTKMQIIGDYCVASLRKWFALPDGGAAYSLSQKIDAAPLSNVMPFTNARTAGMFLKGLYLNGLIDGNEIYRKLFFEAERMIDEENEIFAISNLSNELLKAFDVEKAAERRKENGKFLQKNINNPYIKPIFQDIYIDICPFFYPLYVENRDKFRNYLNKNKIYCPVHWSIEDKRLLEYDAVRYMSENMISIPIDQRYSVSDMGYLCSIINGYCGGNIE